MIVSTLTLPTILTLIRLIVSPVLIPLLCISLLPKAQLEQNLIVAFFFALLSITDLLDGFIARRYKLETTAGKVLDPIADKFLLFSTVIALVSIGRLSFYWALILVGREFFIMGLREFALSHGRTIVVSFYGKAKTVLQMLLFMFIIINPYYEFTAYAPYWNSIELCLLCITSFISIFSAYLYYKEFILQLKH